MGRMHIGAHFVSMTAVLCQHKRTKNSPSLSTLDQIWICPWVIINTARVLNRLQPQSISVSETLQDNCQYKV